MERSSTSILAGTLVASFLLSSQTKTPSLNGAVEAGSRLEASPAQTRTSKNSRAVAPRTDFPDFKKVSDEARKEYRDSLARLVGDACPPKDCKADPGDFIIALAPDPVHTHLALSFDRTMEVIQEALQDEGYTYSGSIMPWEAAPYPDSDQLSDRLETLQYEQTKQEYPGLMAFAGRKPLFVLVVGETPTGGINRKQFKNAIMQIATKDSTSRREWKPEPGKAGLRILGPSFSGSLASLRQLLTECEPGKIGKANDAEFTYYAPMSIYSGSVSSEESIDRFTRSESAVNATFLTFQESDTVVIKRFIEYMTGDAYGRRGYRADRMALLSEDETAYGSGDGTPMVLKLYFPREISQFRAAYEKELSGAEGASAGPRDILPLGGDVSGEDSVAEFSSRQRVLSQEGLMQGLVAELRGHKIQFVLVRATDPMDTLFVSRYLRKAYPDGRVVTMGADMLFRREAEDPEMHGLLSLSTYSPAPGATHDSQVSQKSNVERVFPSSDEAGTYNALLSLMRASVDRAANREDSRTVLRFKSPTLIQYGWRPEETAEATQTAAHYGAPPVRLLALGRDNYWPLAVLGPYDGEDRTRLPYVDGANQIEPTLKPIELPTSWRAVQLATVWLALAFCAALWRSSIFSNSQTLARFAPAFSDSRAKVVLIGGSALTLIILILLWPSTHNAKWEREDCFLWLCVAPVTLITVWELLDRGWLAEPGAKRRKSWFFAALFIALVGIFGYFALRGFENPWSSTALLRYFNTLRATQLTSGLSFIMPFFFFLSAWLWWANSVVGGYALLDDRRARLPQGMEDPRFRTLGLQVPEELAHVLNPGISDYAVVLLLLAALGVDLWFMVDWRHISLERSTPHWMMVISLALALAGAIGSTLRLRAIWSKVKRLLEALDSQPLRRGFSRMEGFSWKPIWRLGAYTMTEVGRIISREREALKCAMNTVPELEWKNEDLDKGWEAVIVQAAKARNCKRWLGRVRLEGRRAEIELVRIFGGYQKLLARAGAVALDYLAQHWLQSRKEAKDTQGVRALERFVCLIYVACVLGLLARIRMLIVAIGGMYVLILVGIAQYPFEPRAAIQVSLIVLLAFIVYVVGAVFAQMHRDSTLSQITGTKPGELGGDFWLRIASFVALPLFTLLSSQFPSLNRALYTWIRPAIEALNR